MCASAVPPQQFSRGRRVLDTLKQIVLCSVNFLWFTGWSVLERALENAPALCLGNVWISTKMLRVSRELFFPFLASLSLPCVVPCSVNAFLYTHLHIFFPLPHRLFDLYCLAFLFPTSYFILILYPSWIHLIICQCRRISAAFLSAAEGEIHWSHFMNSACILWHVLTPFAFHWPFPLVSWSSHLKIQRGNASW